MWSLSRVHSKNKIKEKLVVGKVFKLSCRIKLYFPNFSDGEGEMQIHLLMSRIQIWKGKYHYQPPNILRGGGRTAPPPAVFCPVLKTSTYEPYLNIKRWPNILLRMPIWKKHAKMKNNMYFNLFCPLIEKSSYNPWFLLFFYYFFSLDFWELLWPPIKPFNLSYDKG